MQTRRPLSKRADGTPLITIVTVVLNGEEYLEQAIRSVINQPYEHIEYIVIDGGSRDGTLDIIRRYEKQIDYWVSEPDEGIYHAMNKGWAASHGDYVYYLGADDVLLGLPVSSLAKACSDNVDLVYGDVCLSNGRYFRSRYGMGLLFNNSLHHQGLFLKRSLFEKPPFRNEYKVFSDFDLNQRLYKQRKRALAVHEPIALFRLTRSREQSKSAEFFQIVRDNFGVIVMVASYLFLKLRGLAFRLRGWDR
jgi:glycosyltransferase involved in cell wall biosynthesis